MTDLAPQCSLGASFTKVSLQAKNGRGKSILQGVDVTFRAGVITGLLGASGSGKSTMHSMLAGTVYPTSGEVRVDDRNPYDDRASFQLTALAAGGRNREETMAGLSVARVMRNMKRIKPTWNESESQRLLDAFGLDSSRWLSGLSLGESSLVECVLALASQSPLTLLDEVDLGVDVKKRALIIDAILESYAEHQGTYIVSTHLADEWRSIFEDVVVMEAGQCIYAGTVDYLIQEAPASVSKLSDAVSWKINTTKTNHGAAGAAKSTVRDGLS